jgi:hypothetical protein
MTALVSGKPAEINFSRSAKEDRCERLAVPLSSALGGLEHGEREYAHHNGRGKHEFRLMGICFRNSCGGFCIRFALHLSRPYPAPATEWSSNLHRIIPLSVSTLDAACRNGVWKHLSLLKEMHRRTMAD